MWVGFVRLRLDRTDEVLTMPKDTRNSPALLAVREDSVCTREH